MTDELRAALQSVDPMPSTVPTESVTSPRGRRRLEDIMSTPNTQNTPSKNRRTPALWYAAAAAAVIAVIALGVVALGSNDPEPVAAEPLTLTAGPSNTLASCIVPSAEILADVEIAFAGTVTNMDGEAVTLDVAKWFVGGNAATVVVEAPSGLEALIGSVPFELGEDFLVSATGNTVNYCGLSGPATPEFQALYDAAFPG